MKILQEGIKLLSGHHVLAQHCNTDGAGFPYITGPADFPKGIIQHSKFTEKPSTICRANDILVTVKGSGAGTIVLSNAEYCISRQLMAIRVTDWDTTFIYSTLLQDAALFGAAATGLIPGLSRGEILNKQIAVPPLPEQHAIAGALGDVDALLGALEKLIAKKRDLKQAAMQQLLTGQQRLPGFNGEWEAKRLGDVADLRRENVVPADHPNQLFVHFSLPAFDSGKVPVVELGAAIGSNKFRVPREAILVSKLNPRIPRVWAPAVIPEESISSTEFLVLVPRGAISRDFLHIVCSSPHFCDQMELAATGTTGSHQRTNPIDALAVTLSIPLDSAEQTAIAAVLSDMDTDLAALEARLAKTRALKQGMMQELLTGKVRLV